MDRIRKALDLARQERNRSVDCARDEARPFESEPASVEVLQVPFAAKKSFSPVPAVLESNRLLDMATESPATAAFRMLRTQVLQRLVDNQWRALAIFSPGSDDGKTTTAINLALSLAHDHFHTVLLVDFDLRRPTIAAKLGFSPDQGADDLLRGEARIEDCLYHPEGFERLVILPSRAPMTNSSEALASPRARDLVAELRVRYPERILLFDLPPVLGSDDALAFAPLVQCGLMVVAEGSTRREDLLRCMELLRNTPLVGTVLNRSSGATSAYG